MSSESHGTSGGTSIIGLLGVAFVVLKLCHVIDWPWIWVLAPFWMGVALAVVVVLVVIAGIGLIAVFKR